MPPYREGQCGYEGPIRFAFGYSITCLKTYHTLFVFGGDMPISETDIGTAFISGCILERLLPRRHDGMNSF